MLQFFVNNRSLVLSEDTQIRLEVNFPYFEIDGISSSIVWHFDLPIEENEDTFKYANYLQIAKRIRIYDCIVKVHSFPIGRGKLTLENISKKFRVSMLINSFAVDFDKIKVNSAINENYTLGSTQAERRQMAADINNDNVDVPFRFPMLYAPNWYGEINDAGKPANNENYLGYVNNYQNGEFVVNSRNTITSEVSNRNSLCPFFFLKDIFKLALKAKAWKVNGSLLNDIWFERFLVHNNYPLDVYVAGNVTHVGTTADGITIFILAAGSTPQDDEHYKVKWNRVIQDDTMQYDNGTYYPPEAGVYEIRGEIAIESNYFRWTSASRAYAILTLSYKLNNTVVFSRDVRLDVTNPSAIINLDALAGTFSARPVAITVPNDTSTIHIDVRYKSVVIYPHMGIDLITSDPAWVNREIRAKILETSDVRFSRRPGINVHTNIEASNHMPAINVTTLLNQCRLAFGSALFFDSEEKVLQIEMLNDILDNNKNPFDITNYAIADEVEIIMSEPREMVFKFAENTEKISRYEYQVDYGYQIPLGTRQYGNYAYARYEAAVYKSEQDNHNNAGVLNPCKWVFFGYRHEVFNDEFLYEDDEDETAQVVSVEMRPCNMASFKNVSEFTLPYHDEIANSPFNFSNQEAISLTLSSWEGMFRGYPRTASAVSLIRQPALGVPYPLPIHYDFNFNDNLSPVGQASLRKYVERWANWQKDTEQIKVPLTNITLWEMLDLMKLNKPGQKNRWINYRSIKCLPKQFTFIINVNGEIVESEAILVKKRES
jgi:hypothetical protein